MLLVAYLRALAARHESLGPASKKLLFPMIHVSDNDTATIAFQMNSSNVGMPRKAATSTTGPEL